MPEKSRTPPPPRRPVQAPRARSAERGRGDRKRWLIPLIGGLVGLGVLAAVLGFVFAGGGGGSALTDAGCTVETAPAVGRQHVGEPPKRGTYNSSPPTTGPHHPNWVPFGAYDEPIEQFRLVHNLEHGGMVVQYGREVPRTQIEQLLEWYRDSPNGVVLAPLPALGDQFALGAWQTTEEEARRNPQKPGRGVLAKCGAFDEGAFDEFKDRYAFQGPERFTEEQLQPGS